MEIQLPQIIFQIINFGVVAGALTYFLFKPVRKVLEERAKRVEEGQIAAEKAIAEAQKLEELKKSAKQKAEREASKLLEEATQTAKAQKSRLVAEARTEALAEVEKLRLAWEEEKQADIKNMKKEFADAVIAAAEKVVGGSLDAKSQAKLIDQELSNLVKSL